jgi:hypothetical protein
MVVMMMMMMIDDGVCLGGGSSQCVSKVSECTTVNTEIFSNSSAWVEASDYPALQTACFQ